MELGPNPQTKPPDVSARRLFQPKGIGYEACAAESSSLVMLKRNLISLGSVCTTSMAATSPSHADPTEAAIRDACREHKLWRGVSGDTILHTARSLGLRDWKVAARVALVVVKLQAAIRTREQRKAYGVILQHHYEEMEEASMDEEKRRLEESMAFLERINTERDLADTQMLRNRSSHLHAEPTKVLADDKSPPKPQSFHTSRAFMSKAARLDDLDVEHVEEEGDVLADDDDA
jgi:hypothetical protein